MSSSASSDVTMEFHLLSYRTIILLLSTFLYLPCHAQVLPVNSIEQSYNEMNYEQTIQLSNQAVQEYEAYKPEELIKIYQFQALSYFHLADTVASRRAFISLLSLNQNFELDPVLISPKIINFFERIKVDYQSELINEAFKDTRYIQLEDPRPAAGWRSLILPGWGQIYKGDNLKGYITLSAFALNSTALIISIINENKYKDIYISSTRPDDINSTYDEYNKWHRTRQYLTYSQILIWSYAVADAIWSPIPSTSLSFSPEKITIYYQF